jgi:phosphatidylserine synthase
VRKLCFRKFTGLGYSSWKNYVSECESSAFAVKAELWHSEKQNMLTSSIRFVSFSNFVSYISLAAAFASIHFAFKGDIHLMAGLWAISACADNFDGKFARLFTRSEIECEFGQELDSLIDEAAFGFAPIAGLWMIAFPTSGLAQIVFITAALFYLIASVTRLGHFNILHRKGVENFWGLPTTEAALLLSTMLLIPGSIRFTWIALAVLGGLMVFPIPIPRPGKFMMVFMMLWMVSVIVSHLLKHFWL